MASFSSDAAKKAAAYIAEEIVSPAQRYRKQVARDDRWRWFRTLYSSSGHWDGSRLSVPDGFDKFEANIIMPTIDTVKGIALQSPSVIEFAPMTPDDEELCRYLNVIIGDYLWSARKARYKLGVAFLEGAIIGTAWTKTYWNPSLNGGKGDVDFFVVPAEEIFVDPATTGPGGWDYIVHRTRRPLVEVARNESFFEDARAQVSPDNVGRKDDEPPMKLVTLDEVWLRGPYAQAALEAVPELARFVSGSSAAASGIVITIAGDGTVLSAKDNPYGPRRFPFQRFVYYPPTGDQRVYGSGEVEYLEDVQVAIDARMMQILNQAALIANGQWLVSNGIVVDEGQFTAEPGAVIRVEGPVSEQFIRRIAPDNISSSLFNIVNLLLHMTQYISGMYEANRGQQPGSIRSGVAIAALQRGGEGRTRQKMDNFDDFVADLALGMYDVMANFYDEERVFRIVAEQGVQTPDGADTVPGEPIEVTISKDMLRRDGEDIVLDVRAQVGLMLRSPREQLLADIELAQAGIVDAQYVIENNMLRGKDKLMARLFAAQQAAAGQVPAPEEGQQPEEGFTPEEDMQIEQVIQAMLAKMQALEEQGVLPQGTTQDAARRIQAERDAGGTGEEAMAEIAQRIAMLVDQENQLPPQVGIANASGGM